MYNFVALFFLFVVFICSFSGETQQRHTRIRRRPENSESEFCTGPLFPASPGSVLRLQVNLSYKGMCVYIYIYIYIYILHKLGAEPREAEEGGRGRFRGCDAQPQMKIQTIPLENNTADTNRT